MNRCRLLLIILIGLGTSGPAFAQPAKITVAQAPKMSPVEQQIRRQIMEALRNQGALSGGQIIIRSGDVTEGGNDNPFADEGDVDPNADPADAEVQEAVNGRLEQLAELPFNRLPSHIFKTWAKPTKPTVADPTRDELPPAPPKAVLYSDVRFAMAKEKLLDDFTLGNWDGIETFLELLPEANASSVYDLMLNSASGMNAAELQGGDDADYRTLQQPFFSLDDVVKLAAIAPDEEFKDANLGSIATTIGAMLQRGVPIDDVVSRLSDELKSETSPFDRRQTAKLINSTGNPLLAAEFLPTLDDAKAANDHEALNLLSQIAMARYSEDEKRDDLEQAWSVTQAILSAKDVDEDERAEALKRAISLSSQVSESLSQEWLTDSFIDRPEVGIAVLSSIGKQTSSAMLRNPMSPQPRLERLKLQDDAVSAFLTVGNVDAEKWSQQLELMAINWLREAELTRDLDDSTSLGPSMRRDSYGNIFYYEDEDDDDPYGYYRSSIETISTGDILLLTPSDDWLNRIDKKLMPQFNQVRAQLYLKVGQQDQALPFIESLAKSHPDRAELLANEFLDVWTTNHDPNASSRRTNSYMYMWGYEEKADGIPLTRSRQVRNLKELAELVPRLEAIVGKDKIEPEQLLSAFMTCHSSAEVYRAEDIEQVFGPIEKMDPETVATLTDSMRSMLATMWRDIKEQKDKKTKRKKPELEQEVIRGYQAAQAILDRAIKAHPDAWELMVTNASLMHDENNYRAGIANSSEFSPRRIEALAMFRTASQQYVDGLEEMEGTDYTTRPLEMWFYASLGACDLGLIKEEHLPDPKQPPLIKAMIESMPERARDWHESRFANLLFNRMSSVKSQLKSTYLDAGFEIVGDHPQAHEAREVHEYYGDLVSEIELKMEIDGSDRVGHESPFGVMISIDHTVEIERESGGFGKYLQNQNSSNYYSYNYGRPTEDYRDKFEEMATRVLGERFEVLSTTFETPEVQSIALAKRGWRRTPYAYILLKAKGAEVDAIPPLKLNLDFLDTSGYVILPVESNLVPVDADMKTGDPRPYADLQLTQILDERQAEDDVLIVEIRAVAQGLIPSLESVVDAEIEGFEIIDVEDPGVSVDRFDPEANTPVVQSQRNWIVKYQPQPGLAIAPAKFSFPSPIAETKEVVYQRYEDADLAAVEPTVSLKRGYRRAGPINFAAILTGIVAVLGVVLLAALAWLVVRKREQNRPQPLQVDDAITPFAALSVLRQLERDNGYSDPQRRELVTLIDRIESNYFGRQEPDTEVALAAEVRKWASRAKVAT